MGSYVVKRLIQGVILLFLVSFLIFLLMQATGDPTAALALDPRLRPEDRQRMRVALDLDQPIPVRYVYWLIGNDWTMKDLDLDGVPETQGRLKGILRGDLGNSISNRQPVTVVIGNFLPNTLLLGLSSYIVTISLALLIGIYAAMRPYSLFDNIFTTISFILFSMPIFFIALTLIYVFAVGARELNEVYPWVPYFPVEGMYEPRIGKTFEQVIWHMVLPVTALASIQIAGHSRYIRASMRDVLNQDYIRTAHAKGLEQRSVLFRHALKNAALPLVTLIGLDLPFVVGGAIVTESIFSWPGIGRLFVRSLDSSDFPVLMAILMLIAVLVVVFQLLTDLVYTLLDPRISYS